MKLKRELFSRFAANPISSSLPFFIIRWAMRIALISPVGIARKSSALPVIECCTKEFTRKVRFTFSYRPRSLTFCRYLERPYKCEQCQKAFAHKANYVSHLKTHEAKAYDCKHCGLQNPTAAKLRQHEDQEHPEERPFRCCYCNKSFKVSHSLEAHKQKCSESLLDVKPSKFFNYYPVN